MIETPILHNNFLDGFDVIAEYDNAIKNLITIPLDVDYAYSREELEIKSLDKLKAIAIGRNVFSKENKELIINAILNSQRIPVNFVSGSTWFSSSEYVTGTIEPTNPANESINFSYPAISISRINVKRNLNRYFGAKKRKIAWTTDGNAVLQSKPLIPIDIMYQIDAISLNFYHSNIMDAYLFRLFGEPIKRITVNHGNPWGVLPIFINMDHNMRDASRLESSDIEKGEKIIRHIYTLTLEGWITTETVLIPTVRKLKTVLLEENFATNEVDVFLETTEKLKDIYL